MSKALEITKVLKNVISFTIVIKAIYQFFYLNITTHLVITLCLFLLMKYTHICFLRSPRFNRSIGWILELLKPQNIILNRLVYILMSTATLYSLLLHCLEDQGYLLYLVRPQEMALVCEITQPIKKKICMLLWKQQLISRCI